MRPVCTVTHDWEPVAYYITGDPHTFKHPAATALLKQQLDEAKSNGDHIIVWGDIHDWIAPGDKMRYSAKQARKVDAYVNDIVAELYEFYLPYVDNIDVIKLGNHETAFIKHNHVDPMAILIDRLNQARSKDREPIFYGGYTCWFAVKFVNNTKQGTRNRSTTYKMWLHHGAGGSAPVTKGAIDRARIQDAITGADCYVIGHKHSAISVPVMKEALDDYGNVCRFMVDFVCVPGFSTWDQKEPDTDAGYLLEYSAERFYGLEAMGGCRVKLTPKRESSGRRKYYVESEITQLTSSMRLEG